MADSMRKILLRDMANAWNWVGTHGQIIINDIHAVLKVRSMVNQDLGFRTSSEFSTMVFSWSTRRGKRSIEALSEAERLTPTMIMVHKRQLEIWGRLTTEPRTLFSKQEAQHQETCLSTLQFTVWREHSSQLTSTPLSRMHIPIFCFLSFDR